MFFKKLIFLIGMSSLMYANPWKFEYSYGVHDFVVDDEFHTLGVNAGIYMTHTVENGIHQSGYFETFIDYNKEELDPDHIPVWFRADYEIDKVLIDVNENFNIKGVYDFTWKMNTVSSIEQYLKAGVGLGFNYTISQVSFGVKVLGGTYYLEIDDDVPKENGYSRNDLTDDFQRAYAYVASVDAKFTQDVSAHVEYEQWYNNEEWLEKSFALKLKYDTLFLSQSSTIQLSVEGTTYNLSSLEKNNVPVLPWDDDMLLKLSVHVPF